MLAVKIDNHPRAQPWAGLEQADVVIEEIIEGGATRFLALFQSRLPGLIGPIRSARLIDAELLPPLRPVLAASGARDEVVSALRTAGVATLLEDRDDPEPFSRAPDRPRVHDLVADPRDLLAAGEGLPGVGDPRWAVTYDRTAPPGGCVDEPGCPAGALRVPMTDAITVEWAYDPDANVYRRSQNGRATTVTGPDRVGPANVVVIGAQVAESGCCDASGAAFVRTQVLGTGEAVVLRDGRAYAATWTKGGRSQPLELRAPDGSAMPLRPGATWMHFAPTSALPDVPAPARPSTPAAAPSGG